jgi:hypothetical protein
MYSLNSSTGSWYASENVLPVLPELEVTGNFSGVVSRVVDTIEETRGRWEDVAVRTAYSKETRNYPMVFERATNLDIANIRQTFIWARGGQKSFIVPSDQKDFEYAVAGDATMFYDNGIYERLVALNGGAAPTAASYALLPPVFVRTNSGNFLAWITSIVKQPRGLVKILFTRTLNNNPGTYSIISWANCVKFANDAMTFSYRSTHAVQTTLGLTSVNDPLDEISYPSVEDDSLSDYEYLPLRWGPTIIEDWLYFSATFSPLMWYQLPDQEWEVWDATDPTAQPIVVVPQTFNWLVWDTSLPQNQPIVVVSQTFNWSGNMRAVYG